MKTTIIRLVVLFAAAVGFVTTLAAQEPVKAIEPVMLGRVTGRVLDALGNGAAAAKITVRAAPGSEEILRSTITDADGMFVVANLPLDDTNYLRLRAEQEGRCADTVLVGVTKARPETWTTLRLWDAGELDVRVVDAVGGPLEGVTVIVEAHESRIFGLEPNGQGVSDEEGRLTMGGLPLGAVDVRAWLAGHQLAEATLWLRDRGKVELQLEKGEGVSLRVRVEGLPDQREARIGVLPYGQSGHVVLPGLAGPLTTTDSVWSYPPTRLPRPPSTGGSVLRLSTSMLPP